MAICCVVHGSFRKYPDLIQEVCASLRHAGVEILAPKASMITSFDGGFALFAGEEGQDPRIIEGEYLGNIPKLGRNGFSYFINPDRFLGKSAAFELGVALAHHVRCFFSHPLRFGEGSPDPPAFVPDSAIWSVGRLVAFIKKYKRLPRVKVKASEHAVEGVWKKIFAPCSTVAVGAVIEHASSKTEKELLFVKTHQWANRWSLIGERVGSNELLTEALVRGVRQETGLKATVGRHICTFDQVGLSTHRPATRYVFVDHVVHVSSKRVILNEEAEECLWLPAPVALRELNIEPNARLTIEHYMTTSNH